MNVHGTQEVLKFLWKNLFFICFTRCEDYIIQIYESEGVCSLRSLHCPLLIAPNFVDTRNKTRLRLSYLFQSCLDTFLNHVIGSDFLLSMCSSEDLHKIICDFDKLEFFMNQKWDFFVFTNKGNRKSRGPVRDWRNRIQGLPHNGRWTRHKKWTRITRITFWWIGQSSQNKTLHAAENHLALPMWRKAAHICWAQWKEWVDGLFGLTNFAIKVTNTEKRELSISQCTNASLSQQLHNSCLLLSVTDLCVECCSCSIFRRFW